MSKAVRAAFARFDLISSRPTMKRHVVLAGLAVSFAALSGCHSLRSLSSCHKPKPYMNDTSIAALQVPPGMDAPDMTNTLRIPALNEPAPPPRKGKEPCLDEPPPFNTPKQALPQA
jgi:uncharacterized lipoprotein